MHQADRSRSALRVAIIGGFLLLAFAVFAWGLHAKLSLYEAHAVPSTANVAKLLTTQKTGRDLVSIPSDPSSEQDVRELALAFVTLLIVLPALRVFWLTPEAVLSRVQDDPGDPGTSSRPPPFTLAHADFLIAS